MRKMHKDRTFAVEAALFDPNTDRGLRIARMYLEERLRQTKSPDFYPILGDITHHLAHKAQLQQELATKASLFMLPRQMQRILRPLVGQLT